MSSKEVPWWAPEAEFVVLLGLAACLATSVLSGSRFVQATPYGVIVLAALVGSIAHWLLKILMKYEFLRPETFSLKFLERWKPWYVCTVVVLPFLVSWSENHSLSAAWNPIGYWNEELTKAKSSDCNLLQSILTEAAETLRVAQNKYSMGIATSGEVRDALFGLKTIKEVHDSCVSELRKRIDRAQKRIAEISHE